MSSIRKKKILNQVQDDRINTNPPHPLNEGEQKILYKFPSWWVLKSVCDRRKSSEQSESGLVFNKVDSRLCKDEDK